MRASKKLLAGFAALITIGLFAFTEPAFLIALKSKLSNYNRLLPSETIYLQFDKPFYKPGEDIWFNAYLLNSTTLKPSQISDVFYVELIDPRGSVVSKLDLSASAGSGRGDFKLSTFAAGGIYTVRAYTQWMKNFGEESFYKRKLQIQAVIEPRLLMKVDFEKRAYGPGDTVVFRLDASDLDHAKIDKGVIHYTVSLSGEQFLDSTAVTNSNGHAELLFLLPHSLKSADGYINAKVNWMGVEESVGRTIPIALNHITMNFFPEGGDLVENISSRIAFKAVNEFGKGADVHGVVVDDTGKEVAGFKSYHLGMGAFQFTPQRGHRYFAHINRPANQTVPTLLPIALASGYTMAVARGVAERLAIKINSPLATEGFLVALVHGRIVSSESIRLAKGQNSFDLNAVDFPQGIAVISLFDAAGVPRCERLTFVRPDKTLSVKVTPSKKTYAPGEQVKLSIRTTDPKGNPIPAALSLSVVDDKLLSFADDRQDNIQSWFLLSSEVKGEVEEPKFYFDPEESKAPEALDYLLMTQGWRRFTWKSLDKEPQPKIVAEDFGTISGKIVGRDLVGNAGEVIIYELNGKHRILHVATDMAGNFVLKNADPTTYLVALTKKPNRAIVECRQGQVKSGTAITTFGPDKELERDETFPRSTPAIVKPVTTVVGQTNYAMKSDVTQLSEVIVTGYGSQEARSLTGCVWVARDYNSLPSDMLTILQGRVPGLQIQVQNGTPASTAVIRSRGLSTQATLEPLLAIDGIPVESSTNNNFTNLSTLPTHDVQSIQVINSPEANVLYGSAASGGVILVTTRSNIPRSYAYQKRKESKFNSITIPPRAFSVTREYYDAPTALGTNGERQNFRSTIYWNPGVYTDSHGEAELTFYNNDAASAFRITTEGIDGNGLIGRSESTYETRLPFSMEAKIPEFIGFEDNLLIPVMIRNTTDHEIEGHLAIEVQDGLVVNSPTIKVTVPTGMSKVYTVPVRAKGVEGIFKIDIKLSGGNYEDKIHRSIRAFSTGFPMRISLAGNSTDTTIHFNLSEAESGTYKASFVAYPDLTADLFRGVESILAEPHGCFEQVSSSTFPNILALQFLKKSGAVRPEVADRALGYIAHGYKLLAGYEIKGGGFEWFGQPAAHEALSAYGLIEFTEMMKVADFVDPQMVGRTRKWLLSRRDGNGGFKQHTGKYGFSGAPKTVNNAYIVYALAETGAREEIFDEYRRAFQEAVQSQDMYRTALLANAAHDLGKTEDYKSLLRIFTEQFEANGIDKIKAEASFVCSYGKSLECETIAIWALAFAKEINSYRPELEKCIQFILSARSGGSFGSSQATTVCLQALTAHASIRPANTEGQITIYANERAIDSVGYDKFTVRELAMINSIATHNEKESLRIQFNGQKKSTMSYSLDLTWRARTPATDSSCKVAVSTKIDRTVVSANSTVRMQIRLVNKTSGGLPMSMAVIGIPAGLSLQPWQLKELQEKGVFDFYEIIGDRIAFYYRELGPQGSPVINLDLKAEVPGVFVSAASSGYLYYQADSKDWKRGVRIEVTPK